MWLASVDLPHAEYPMLTPLWMEDVCHGMAAVPLKDGDSIVGSMGWGFRDAQAFGAEQRQQLLGVAARCAAMLGDSQPRSVDAAVVG